MSKPLRFTIFKMQRGSKILYRIRIPARFAASGKKTDLYYKTRAEAEEEQALLREKFANGELTLGTILGPGQVKDAQQALELLAEHKLNTSLLNAARAIVSLNPDQFKDAFQAIELIKDNGSEISLVEAASLAIEQRKARMIGIPTKDLLTKYKEAVSEVRHWTAKHLANWRFYSTKFDSYFGEKNIADIQAPELREWFSKNFPSATYFNSALSVIAPAFTWAVKQEMLKRSPFDLIERRKVVKSDGVDIFTIEETRRLLCCCKSYKTANPSHPMAAEDGTVPALFKLDCRDTLLPFSLLLFSGIRPEELEKMTWDLIHLDKGIISVPPSIAKTNQVRNIELHGNLKAYLSTIPKVKRAGKLIPTNWKRKSAIVRKAAGLQNRPDAARHSFASYSLAVDPNIHKLKENLGHTKNSDVLFKHYRAAVTKQDAERYWKINPLAPMGTNI